MTTTLVWDRDTVGMVESVSGRGGFDLVKTNLGRV